MSPKRLWISEQFEIKAAITAMLVAWQKLLVEVMR